MASVDEGTDFLILININLNLNSHTQLVVIVLDSKGLYFTEFLKNDEANYCIPSGKYGNYLWPAGVQKNYLYLMII